MKLKFSPTAGEGATPAAAAPDEMQNKLADFKSENSRLAAKPAVPAPATPRELSIRRRVAGGLTRAQAEQSQADQERHDAWLADNSKKYQAARN